MLRGAPAGDYLISVDGPPAPRARPLDAPLALPADPRGFSPAPDISDECWQRGGGGAEEPFSCLGRLALLRGAERVPLSASLGRRAEEVEGGALLYESALVHPQVWRVTLRPIGDLRAWTLEVSGELSAAAAPLRLSTSEGVPYLYLADDPARPTRPPVLIALSAEDARAHSELSMTAGGRAVTLSAPLSRGALTLYIAASFVPRAALAAAIGAHSGARLTGEAQRADRPFSLVITSEE